MSLLSNLQKRSRSFVILLGSTLIGLLGLVDFLTGYELSLSLFYVLPIALITWRTGRRLGIIGSIISASVWLAADLASGHQYSNPIYPLWNSLIRLSFFVIITLLLASLKEVLEHEKELAHTDYLTGAVNSRLFYKLLQIEIERSQRYNHTFTLAYMDLDNFKAVNDQYGHLIGDQVLRTVVGFSKSHLRKSDILARLGGDEFALLLPETTQESACLALSKLQNNLLSEMRRNNWPVTFSIGVVTCCTSSATADELIGIADNLMYTIKRDGKDTLRYTTYSE